MPDRPLTAAQKARRLKPRAALKRARMPLHIEVPPVTRRPGVRVFPRPIKGTMLERPDRAIRVEETARARNAHKVESVRGAQRKELEAVIAERMRSVAALEHEGLDGYLPDHLPFNPRQPEMDERLRRPPFYDSLAKLRKGQHLATTIFAPDQRYVFSDTAFPWCTGRARGHRR